jgi:hypothetical protein
MHINPVGAGLPAKAACQPTISHQMYINPVGVSLLAMAPASQPFSIRCTSIL